MSRLQHIQYITLPSTANDHHPLNLVLVTCPYQTAQINYVVTKTSPQTPLVNNYQIFCHFLYTAVPSRVPFNLLGNRRPGSHSQWGPCVSPEPVSPSANRFQRLFVEKNQTKWSKEVRRWPPQKLWKNKKRKKKTTRREFNKKAAETTFP